MTETDRDELDLALCDLLAFLKAYDIPLSGVLHILTDRAVALYPHVDPTPVIH